MKTFITVSRGSLHEGNIYLRVHRDHRETNCSLPFTRSSLCRFEKLVSQKKVILTHASLMIGRLVVFYDKVNSCPRCRSNVLQEPKVEHCSLSRMDNETYICNDCGDEEAGLDAGLLYITDDMLERDSVIPKTGESDA